MRSMTIWPSLSAAKAVIEVGGGHRNVLAKPERVVLVDPGVVARLSAIVAETLEAGAGILVEAEAFRAVVARRLRAVQRALALATIEADQVSTRSRPPHYAVL